MATHPADKISNNIASRSTQETNQARHDLSEFMTQLVADPGNPDALRGIKVVLDQSMFGYTLRGVRIVSHPFEDPADGGETRWWLDGHQQPFAIYILISPNPPVTINHDSVVVQQLSDIAHECVHAFLMVRKLPGPDYVPTREEMHRHEAELIEEGSYHGPMWERCAYVVQEAMESVFGYILDLEIAGSVRRFEEQVKNST